MTGMRQGALGSCPAWAASWIRASNRYARYAADVCVPVFGEPSAETLSDSLRALAQAKRDGLSAFGRLASRYGRRFETKWLRDASADEELLGSGDIQSLADLANSFAVIRSMSMVPFTKTTVMRLVIITLLPLLPLTLTVIPLDQMVDHLLNALI